MKNIFFKKTIIATSLCFISLFILSNQSFAQNAILGFKTADKQNKIEKDFDAQLNATRVGQNIKLLSSVPHHVGSVGGKFVSDQIVKIFKDAGWETKTEVYQLMFPMPLTRVLEMSGATNYKAKLKETQNHKQKQKQKYSKNKASNAPYYLFCVLVYFKLLTIK